MGLNMDVNHVWFASLRKYDGRSSRPLRTGELAQIAGRAGRHMNDGTFGTTAGISGLDPDVVEAIENHRFDPLRDLQWRNSELDFRSVQALVAALNAPPPHAALQRVREQDDQLALQTLAAQSAFLPRLHSPKRVKLLWEVCQVPDFRKTMTEEHTKLLSQIFEHLTQGGERLPEDWIDSHVKRLERFDGDIDTLMARIAHVRTWTYISHRPDWIQRASHWQERARAIEDRLSDVLHQRLTQRFVDRRAALLVRRLRDEGEMNSTVAAAGEVIVEGEHLGRIEGFRFVPDATEGQTDQKAVLSAALRALRQDLPDRLQAFVNSPDGEIVFDGQLRVCWGGGPVARLLPSGDVLAPKVEAIASDLLDGPAREEVRKRAATWVETRIRLGLSELMDARATAELPAGARGVVFQLCEGLGVLQRRPVEEQLAQLGDEDRKALARLGVRIGVFSLYFPSMLKPVPIRLRAGLWMIAKNRETIPSCRPRAAPRWTCRAMPSAISTRPSATCRWATTRSAPTWSSDWPPWRGPPCARAAKSSRRTQQQEKPEKKPAAEATGAAPAIPAPATADEISEWAIVAAAFGETEPAPAPEPETEPQQPLPAGRRRRAGRRTCGRACRRGPRRGCGRCRGGARRGAHGRIRRPNPRRKLQRGMPPCRSRAPHHGKKPRRRRRSRGRCRQGWFRATPQMMSLVGCSEPEMANVLRALGYRVHPPTEESGPLYAFSIKPRFVREREEQRERQRQQQREQRDQRDQRRRDRPERPNERQFFSDTPRPPRAKDDGPRSGPRPGGGQRADAPRPDGPRSEAPRQDRNKDGRPPQENRGRDDRRGPRPPRRDNGGPALRLYATTETKGDAAADSPFAKLLELKLGGKK